MKCQKCGAELSENAIFCRECGTKVVKNKRFCRECGSVISDGAKFCSNCGAKINFKENIGTQRVGAKSVAANESFDDTPIDEKSRAKELKKLQKKTSRKPKLRLKYLVLAVVALFAVFNVKNYFSEKTSQKAESPSISQNQQTDEENGIYTYQVRNYVGKNLASIGKKYGDYRVDEYGCGKLQFVFVATDGMFINPMDEEQLKQYVVIAQNIPDKTSLTIVNLRDNKGKPYSSLVDYQNYEEIVLYVDVVGGNAIAPDNITSPNPSLDRRTCFVRDYAGRNAASFGKLYGDDRIDEYFSGKLRIIFTTKDGSFVDASDLNTLKRYVVVDQDLNANEEFHLTYVTNSRGEEYSSLIKSQSIETITLTVEMLDDDVVSLMPEITTDAPNENNHIEMAVEYRVLSNGKAEISGVSGDGNHVTIESKIDGHEVIKIGAHAFENCDTLESVLFWADIEEIADYAFANCVSLKEVSVPYGTEKIGAHAFDGCTSLNSVILWGSPDIGDYAFANCRELPSISIGYSTKNVGAHAFDGCTALAKVTIWNDATVIGKAAFANCPLLNEQSIRVDDEATESIVQPEPPQSTVTEASIGEDEVRVPDSASGFKFNNYEDVIITLENAGFTNIRTEILYDIIWGWTSEGEVKSVSIDGITSFVKGDIFKKDAEIVITYHMKEEDDPSRVAETRQSAETSELTDSQFVSYSTNTKATVKNGSSGVYSYKKSGSYDIYYIIDFDEGYVYWFTDGNGDSTCDRLKIDSGTLNDNVIVTYHDGESMWSESLYFKYANQPEHLVMEDDDHFQYDFYSTDLDKALQIRDTKAIHDY